LPVEPGSDPATTPRPEIWFRRRISLRQALSDMWHYRELTASLAERDLRIRYKQAVFGVAWALFTPIMLMLVFSLVFSRFARVDTAGVPYPLFAFLGLIPWTFFSNALLSGGMSLVNNVGIVNKIHCPREVFPVAAIIVAAIDAAISLVVLVAIFAIEGFAPKIETLYVPVFLPALIMFTLGVTVGVSIVLVYLRDLRHVLPVVVQFGLLVTPVAYGIGVIVHSTAQLLLYSALNPLAPIIDGLRRTVLQGLPPDWAALGVGTASSALILAAAYQLFKRLETGIADIA
jgi:ABC-2 type transport system permease protein/lipopolysaccharide transport system permease protein